MSPLVPALDLGELVGLGEPAELVRLRLTSANSLTSANPLNSSDCA